ncbi:MAG: helix-turn-helix domain-containing protein, partial [Acidimicrobiia bacterium]|nr:helix-turn-helix domain-containing protein [Acidimicrobiia bacterium]
MSTFLTSQEMQELINVDRSTVYRMAEDGRLPGVKIGRQWRFPADQVAAQLGLATDPVGVVEPVSPPSSASATPVGLSQVLRPGVAQSIADLIGDLLGVMAIITDMDGRPISTVANPCGYYEAVANQPAAVEACMSQWRLFADEPHVAPRWVRTHLGFLCARTFVWVDLKPVGMIVVGGVTP